MTLVGQKLRPRSLRPFQLSCERRYVSLMLSALRSKRTRKGLGASVAPACALVSLRITTATTRQSLSSVVWSWLRSLFAMIILNQVKSTRVSSTFAHNAFCLCCVAWPAVRQEVCSPVLCLSGTTCYQVETALQERPSFWVCAWHKRLPHCPGSFGNGRLRACLFYYKIRLVSMQRCSEGAEKLSVPSHNRGFSTLLDGFFCRLVLGKDTLGCHDLSSTQHRVHRLHCAISVYQFLAYGFVISSQTNGVFRSSTRATYKAGWKFQDVWGGLSPGWADTINKSYCGVEGHIFLHTATPSRGNYPERCWDAKTTLLSVNIIISGSHVPLSLSAHALFLALMGDKIRVRAATFAWNMPNVLIRSLCEVLRLDLTRYRLCIELECSSCTPYVNILLRNGRIRVLNIHW